MSDTAEERELLTSALRGARDTKLLELDRGASRRTGEAFASLFGSSPAMIFADENTFAAVGQGVVDSLRSVGQACADPVILPSAGMYAEYRFVDEIRSRIEPTDAVPIAIGAGTINDLVKLAAFQCGRQYLSVATAASMDGYTAYGASITRDGLKQTFDCPAPLGVIADLETIATAPEGLNASGYADLAAKMPAGADWIAADFLGEEPIDRPIWDVVQLRLRKWMAEPAGIRERNLDSLRRTTVALMMSGFAMQTALTSRVASGAEHQFSHLWDMEGHKHNGHSPSHGFKVAIGSLASIAMYEALAKLDPGSLDVDRAVNAWPDASANDQEIAALFAQEALADKAREESGVKLISRAALRSQLEKLKQGWPELQRRLRQQLYSHGKFRDMLREAGAAYESPQIGISPERLRRSYRQAYHIRRRFTVLDVARRSGLLEPALDLIFNAS
jgi:glycerol-1-phosphate dehydrogenase [NAD(P)+]